MDAARKFVFDRDGSSAYSYEHDMLCYQKIDADVGDVAAVQRVNHEQAGIPAPRQPYVQCGPVEALSSFQAGPLNPALVFSVQSLPARNSVKRHKGQLLCAFA